MNNLRPYLTQSTVFSVSQRWQDWSLTTKGIVLNALPLTVMLAALALIYESEQQAAKLELRVQNALQIQQDIQILQTLLLEASTGVRDYLLTGDANFLTGYHQAKSAMPDLQASLSLKLIDRSQQQLFLVIRPLISKNLEDLSVLASNTDNEANPILIEKFSSQGASLSQLQQNLQQMGLREASIVAREKKQVISERKRNFTITLAASVAGVLGSLLSMWIFANTIVNRVRTIRDSAHHLAKGEPLALPMISRDELGQLTAELAQASQRLSQSTQAAHIARVDAEEASAAKSQFLSRTSHELRTPLNAILGFAQVLTSELPEGRQRENANQIYSAGQHLLKLINEVLDISRIERGDMTLNLESLALSPLLYEASNYIAPLGKIRDITLVTEVANGLYVKADKQRLLQVVLNLLSNALKYGPENSQVNLRAIALESSVRIEVLDQGTGIPVEKLGRLFTPFDRLGAQRTTTEGTGLGLALSQQLVLAMGGKIGVEQTRSLFWVEIPIADAPELIQNKSPDQSVQTAPGPFASSANFAGKKHMLYVEDHVSNRALMETLMAKHKGYKLHVAGTLQQAMIWLRDMTPDVMLIDLNLPDGSGEQLIQHCQSQPHLQQIPLIVLSADAMPETINRVKAMGVDYYFTKPLHIGQFNQALQQLQDTQ